MNEDIKFRPRFCVDWVLIDELAIGPAPRNLKHMDILKKKGIISVLSLCSIQEAPPPKEMNALFKCERFVLPDHRIGIPPTLDQIKTVLDILNNLQKPAYIHCVAAMERSPLVCICWLIRTKSLSVQESLEYLMQVHPGTSPLPEQLEIAESYYSMKLKN